jgi:hypothetical protein
MAEVPTPPRKSNSKGTPPLEIEASANLKKSNEEDLLPLTFKVSKSFKKEFRGIAFEEEISMTELLKKSFQLYKEVKHGKQ